MVTEATRPHFSSDIQLMPEFQCLSYQLSLGSEATKSQMFSPPSRGHQNCKILYKSSWDVDFSWWCFQPKWKILSPNGDSPQMKNSQSQWTFSPNFSLISFSRLGGFLLSLSMSYQSPLKSSTCWSVDQCISSLGTVEEVWIPTMDSHLAAGHVYCLHVVANAFCNWNVTLNFRSPSTLCLYISHPYVVM